VSCGACSHFAAGATDASSPPFRGGEVPVIGICRRYPPTVSSGHQEGCAFFPSVHSQHLCGEYQSGFPL
jgi:hypothetical protein